MLNLTNIILIAFGSTKIQETILALKHCQKLANFYDTFFFTDYDIEENHIKHIKIRRIKSYRDYQKFIVLESPEIVLSNVSDNFNGHFLSINWDGFIVNQNAWSDVFLEYDYIGAPWKQYENKVGNGGFCMKSKKFYKVQQKICKNYNVTKNEDVQLCIDLRSEFEKNGCIFAPTDVGFMFSTEAHDYDEYNSFGFHDFKLNPKFEKLIY
jgi:hypothetical protein